MGLKDIIMGMADLSDSRQYLIDNIASPDLVAAVLVVFAKSDGGVSPEENLRMVKLLRETYGFQPGEALELITRLADTRAAAQDLEMLLDSVNKEFSSAEKEELVLMVLKVIAADQEKDAGEMELLEKLVAGLQIPDKALQRVYDRYFEQRGKPGRDVS
jgi:uncharacterized tellurite resistance protein B-like protein